MPQEAEVVVALNAVHINTAYFNQDKTKVYLDEEDR